MRHLTPLALIPLLLTGCSSTPPGQNQFLAYVHAHTDTVTDEQALAGGKAFCYDAHTGQPYTTVITAATNPAWHGAGPDVVTAAFRYLCPDDASIYDTNSIN